MQANDLLLADIVEMSPLRYCTCKEGKTLRAVFGEPDFERELIMECEDALVPV
jgi:hypothetical protein